MVVKLKSNHERYEMVRDVKIAEFQKKITRIEIFETNLALFVVFFLANKRTRVKLKLDTIEKTEKVCIAVLY